LCYFLHAGEEDKNFFTCLGEVTLESSRASVQSPSFTELQLELPSLLRSHLDIFLTISVNEVYLPLVFLQLRQWSTFGSLEITPKIELETTPLSVVTEEKCEILKIPAKDYAKLKSV
jgi:hypothetical protein